MPESAALDHDAFVGRSDLNAHDVIDSHSLERFWIGDGRRASGATHVAFVARGRADVYAIYDAALKAGGRDNGAPGLRPQYHPNYYGAFVFDPDGNNIEAVCHSPAAS